MKLLQETYYVNKNGIRGGALYNKRIYLQKSAKKQKRADSCDTTLDMTDESSGPFRFVGIYNLISMY